jgi:hypothetical protein
MKKPALEKFGLEAGYGFTDSIFVKDNFSNDNIAFIRYSRHSYDNYYYHRQVDLISRSNIKRCLGLP